MGEDARLAGDAHLPQEPDGVFSLSKVEESHLLAS